MSVSVTLLKPATSVNTEAAYIDTDEKKYGYDVLPSGVLAVFKREDGSTEPLIFFGAAAWETVSGDRKP